MLGAGTLHLGARVLVLFPHIDCSSTVVFVYSKFIFALYIQLVVGASPLRFTFKQIWATVEATSADAFVLKA